MSQSLIQEEMYYNCLQSIRTIVYLKVTEAVTTFYTLAPCVSFLEQSVPSNDGNCSNSLEISIYYSLSPAHHGSVETYSSHSTNSLPVSGWPQNLYSLTQPEHCKAFSFSGKWGNMFLTVFPNCFPPFLCIKAEKILHCA